MTMRLARLSVCTPKGVTGIFLGWLGKSHNCGVPGLPLLLLLLLATAGWDGQAAPFNREFDFRQPDGTLIRYRGWGNEFQAVFEDLNGYTILFQPSERAFYYARVAVDGRELESSGLLVGIGDPQTAGLAKHLRVPGDLARQRAREKYQAWDQQLHLSERWQKLKENLADKPQASPMGPPNHTTLGTKCGLCLLIDFDNTTSTIAQGEVVKFLNGDDYTGYGNKGSVKSYYYDNSNGKLTYTNVVTAYVRIPNSLHPRSYYDNISMTCQNQGNLLIRDALNILKKQTNYATEVLPAFKALTTDSQNMVVAMNVFFAGSDSGVWGYGLWPHTGGLNYVGQQYLSTGGKTVFQYQISNLGSQLTLTTFCHENGHLLCGFPDIYDQDYDYVNMVYDSIGGAGDFCLMNPGSRLPPTNPPQFCAYLKLAAGWGTAIDFTSGFSNECSLASSGPDFNRFYRYRKPGVSTEYFLLENRQKIGRDASLPAAGIAVWHIDELGDASNQSLKPNTQHANYEVTLVQADNLWHFENNKNSGDAYDLYYKGNRAIGYANLFSDLSLPSANWWNGNRSGLVLHDFSTTGTNMTFLGELKPLVILTDPVSKYVATGEVATLTATMASSGPFQYQWYKDGLPLTNDDRTSGADASRLAIAPATLLDTGSYYLVVTNGSVNETSRVAKLTVKEVTKLTSLDLGDARELTGITTMTAEGWDMDAAGSGLVSVADGCRFAYQVVSGDFDVKVQLSRLDLTMDTSLAGLAVRENLQSGSRHFSLISTPEQGTALFRLTSRASLNGATSKLQEFTGVSYPDNWLRLRREDGWLSFYRGTDGLRWRYIRSQKINFGTNAYVGLVVSSAVASTKTTASFKNYLLQTGTPATVAVFPVDFQAQKGLADSASVVITASRNGPLEIPYWVSGTAVAGIDYEPLPLLAVIPPGTNTASVTINPLNSPTVTMPKTVKINLTPTEQATPVAPSNTVVMVIDSERPTGGLLRQFFSGIKGSTMGDLTNQLVYPGSPDELSYVTQFESYRNYKTYYGQVLTGYVTPPSTGSYTFYLAADDEAELWLSTDQQPKNLRRIAQELYGNTYRNWSGLVDTSHISAGIQLVKGRWYCVKVLHKQDVSSDNLSVTWKLPGGTQPANGSNPIMSSYLAFALPQTNAYSLLPKLTNFPPMASTGMVQVVCSSNWEASVTVPWLTILDGASGSGDGQITYRLEPNPGAVKRAGNLVAAGRIHSVFQDAGMVLKLAPQATAGQPLLLTLESDSSDTYWVEASRDLIEWIPIYTNSVFSAFDLSTVDIGRTNEPVRFYRVVKPAAP